MSSSIASNVVSRGAVTLRAMRRLIRERLRDAARELKDGTRPMGQRVHTLRKSIKKVRGLIALTGPVVGKHASRADRRLRKIGASTAAVRDAEVLLNTFETLRPRLAAFVQEESLSLARGRLLARLREARRLFGAKGGIDRLVVKLHRVRRTTKTWVPSGDGSGVPLAGLVDGYRLARRAMRRAYDRPSGAAFHQWRKAVKAHRYQLMVWDVWPKHSMATFRALDRLGELLGEEHDLTVFAEIIGTDLTHFASTRDCAKLRSLCNERRRELRAEARDLGTQLFAERTRTFGRQVRQDLGFQPRGNDRDPAILSVPAPNGMSHQRPQLRLA